MGLDWSLAELELDLLQLLILVANRFGNWNKLRCFQTSQKPRVLMQVPFSANVSNSWGWDRTLLSTSIFRTKNMWFLIKIWELKCLNEHVSLLKPVKVSSLISTRFGKDMTKDCGSRPVVIQKVWLLLNGEKMLKRSTFLKLISRLNFYLPIDNIRGWMIFVVWDGYWDNSARLR